MEPKGGFPVLMLIITDYDSPHASSQLTMSRSAVESNLEWNRSLQEVYVEYSRHGTVIKGQEKAQVKSRYEEDVHISNHTVRFSTRAAACAIGRFTLEFLF